MWIEIAPKHDHHLNQIVSIFCIKIVLFSRLLFSVDNFAQSTWIANEPEETHYRNFKKCKFWEQINYIGQIQDVPAPPLPILFPTDAYLGEKLKCLGVCHPHRRHRRHLRLVAFAWSSPSCCKDLTSEPDKGKFVCHCVSIFSMSTFQTKRK